MTRNSLPSRPLDVPEIDNADVDDKIRVDAGLLIPGRGDPIENGTLVCGTSNASDSNERGKILYVGTTSDLPSKYSQLSVVKVPVLMPGLWDCHVSTRESCLLLGETSQAKAQLLKSL